MPSRMTYLSLVLVAITFFVGCSGRGGGSQGSAPGGLDPENQQRSNDLQATLRKTIFRCSNDSGCPNNVGLILVNFDGEENVNKGQCTGFLIADNIVATNSHCVPPHLKLGLRPCGADLAIRFIDDGIYTCTKLLGFSGHKVRMPDYAFFEIAHTGHAPIAIDASGMPLGRLSVLKIRPLRSLFEVGGILERVDCVSSFNSFLNISAVSPLSPTGLLLDCEVEEGNSGSPVINSAGAAVGILQAGSNGNFKEILETSYPDFKLDMNDSRPSNAQFTNLACVDYPGRTSPKPAECERALKLTLNECAGINNPEGKAKQDALLNAWENSLPEDFVFEISLDETHYHHEATPVCVKPRSSQKINVTYPRLMKEQLTLHVDDSLKLARDLGYAELERVNSQIEVKREGAGWTGEIHEPNTYLGFVSGKFEKSISLSDCTSGQTKNYEVYLKADGRKISKSEQEKGLSLKPDPLCFFKGN